MHKKLSLIPRLKLKLTDPEAYQTYKYLERLSRAKTPPLTIATSKEFVSFKHGGNAGDLIYALPTAFALAQGKPIHLYLQEGKEMFYGKKATHPLGKVMFNMKMINMLEPLLVQQPSIVSCQPFFDQQIDFDLDMFRQYPTNVHAGHIARWYFQVFAISADLGKPWLTAPVDANYKDAIVIARSQRYRSPVITYKFLREYGRVVFVGIEEEYNEMKQMIPQLEYKPVNNFLELAATINGSKLFIGNQSFPFAIAEGLKVKRMLELYYKAPNVIPEGPDAYDFCYQPQFEKIVSEIL
jgi:hypothetical protein